MTEKEYLKQKLSLIGIEASEEILDAFILYYEKLIEKNKVMNLTAITEYQDIVAKHFIDSVILWFWLEKEYSIKKEALAGKKFIDVGTGAGFPGIPLKITNPEISLTLLDALQKRIGFLEEVGNALSLRDVKYVHARSEDAGRQEFREQYDFAVSRAVANLKLLAEYEIPLVKVGGLAIFYKAGEIKEELEEAENRIAELGGKIEKVLSYSLPETDYNRSLIFVRKIKETPKKFPRPSSKIKKDN